MSNSQVIKAVFKKMTSSKNIHEAVMLVEDKSGDFSVGLATGGRDINSPMFMASIGKMFVTTCILILEEQGKIALDDPIDKYLNGAIMGGLRAFSGAKLTISNLLFQTSGIPDWLENGRDKKVFIDNDMFLTLEEKIASIKNDKPHFAPGARTRYSDTNFSILGKIIESITEAPLAQVCMEWIFEPLGLRKTYLPTSEDDFVTKVYYKERALYRPNAMRAASGSGDAITTARELMIFLKAFFGGELFNIEAFGKLSKYGKLQITMGGTWYGGGYMRIPLGSLRTLFRGRGELLGHSGATGSFAFYHTESKLFFVGDFNQLAKPGLPMISAINLATKLK